MLRVDASCCNKGSRNPVAIIVVENPRAEDGEQHEGFCLEHLVYYTSALYHEEPIRTQVL